MKHADPLTSYEINISEINKHEFKISKRIFSKWVWLTFGITFARVWEPGNVSLYYNCMKPPSTQSMNGKGMPFTESQGCCQESGCSTLTTFFFLVVYLQRRRQYHHRGSELTLNWKMSGHRSSGSWLGIRRICGTCCSGWTDPSFYYVKWLWWHLPFSIW